MPTCPGCSRTVSYRELRVHVTDCAWLWSEDPAAEGRWSQHLCERVRRLDERTPAKSTLDRRAGRSERHRDG